MPFINGFTMWLPFLLSVSACFLMPATGEVVQNFDKCLEFFFDNKPTDEALTPNTPARICQVYNNIYRFATMYDKERRIPIYSAYKYIPGSGKRSGEWYVEPQLADQNLGKNMKDERSPEIVKIIEAIKLSQAVSDDYKNAYLIDMGHLNPICHQPDLDSRIATSTVTNVVPQNKTLNQGTWKDYENSVKAKAKNCHDTYIVTGVVPGDKYISGRRVNKPSHIWSAACCVIDNNHRRSWAVIADNEGNDTKERTLRQLEAELAGLYNKRTIDLFHGSCY